jgi:protein-tyrosine phosphatase
MRRWLLGGVVLAGVAVLSLRRRRKSVVYPAAETLILQPELLEESFEGRVRLLKLSGAINLRDMGGYRTKDGKRVKWGMVYRSGSLGKLTEEDLHEFEGLNIKLICDLRHAQETAAEPDRLPTGAVYWHSPVNTDDKERSRKRMRMLLFSPEQLGDLLLETYTDVMIDGNARLFGELLRRLSDSENLPALFHCTAGKDRTGIAAMLLLLTLGVPEETIVADYTLSNLYYQNYLAYAQQAVDKYRWMRIRADVMYPLLVADGRIIQAALDHLHRKYGTVEGYLKTAGGLDDETIARLKANLLEEAYD